MKKTVIVSGASGNLGKAVVEHFLKKNYHVEGIVHRQSELNHQNYTETQADLTKEEEGKQAIEEILKRRKNVDCAVLTAGGFRMGTLENSPLSILKQQYALNFTTAYNLAQPLYSAMKDREGGTLFFIGSMPGMDTKNAKKTVAYSLSKSLLFQLANVVNASTKETNVKAYVIVPSTIDTPQNREAVPDADFTKWEKPSEIATIIGKYSENTKIETVSEIVIQEEM